MSDQQRVKYEPGHALTTWSEEKFARAMQHHQPIHHLPGR